MFKILSECSATVRKSLEGLDYFVAEGSRGFQDDFEKYTSNQDKPYDLRETLMTYDSDNFQSSYMVTDQSSQNTISSSQNTASTIENYNREHYVDLLNNYLNTRKVLAISLPIESWKDSSEYDDIFDNMFKDDEHQDEDDNGNSKMISALIESYEKSSAWQVRRQILSVLAIKLSFKQLINYLPGLTEYRYYVAQKHSILYGCAIPPSETCKTRNKMDLEKLSNFITSSHIIKDLPFGERHLKLSSGEVMDAPNIIRCMGPAAIIQQYQAYCEENEISLLGSSTMFKILSECSATVRKSLEGLDYFVAEGSRGFQDLQDIVLSEGYPETSNGTELNRLLLEAKRYMKTDYKVHVSEENEVADHCRKYALSSTKEEHFKEKCNHDHNKVCESCEQLKELLHGILKKVEIANFTDQQTRDDIVYRAQQAVESIFLWKSHILRARNQEAAKSFLFNYMKEDEIFVVFDWAMKYLPRKYREDQLDWFGKRGISWHISVYFRRNAEELQSLTFVHIFDSQISQDSKTTSATICDVLNNVLKNNPEVKSVHLWSDNAACYKCADTFININNNKSSKGHIASYNFCEAKDGKGACDIAAATFKSGIKRFVNQGNDVVNAKQIKAVSIQEFFFISRQ
ncbi:unnamed protein product [Mytilus coruscus]|uniref:Uncharacterized protein n=1 Tax=Mytilus coruscus TaxID=42192 RepID=A0A6J8ACV7_MYTCO|nr:unnamed protein product [Mytilus coruscus]